MSNVKNLSQMGLNEVFEDLTYNVAYGEVLKRINQNIPVSDGYLKDALQSGLSIVFAGALQGLIAKEIKILNDIINKTEVILIALLGNVAGNIRDFVRRKKSRYARATRGRAGRALIRVLDSASDNRFKMAKIYCNYAKLHYSNQLTQASATSGLPSVTTQTLQADNLSVENKLLAARNLSASINETLLFKLFTGKFTANDRAILQKITGSSEVDINAINKASSFMFVTDDKGNITGLTQAFIDMLNGLGYLKNKER